MAVAVTLSFALIAGNALWQSHQAQRLAELRLLDVDVIDAASRQDGLTQRIGRQVALISAAPSTAAATGAGGPAPTLQQVLAESRRQALVHEALNQRLHLLAERDRTAIGQALQSWQAARERLWYRADALLVLLDNGQHGALAGAVDAAQVEADRAGAAAAALIDVAQRHTRSLQVRGFEHTRLGAALTLLLLAFVSLVVIAPALRALSVQGRRLAQHAAENRRLALVAEHTGNFVLITDRERRLVWANPAFTRFTGYALDQALGRKPGELLQSERTDPATVARLRDALERGEAVRAELLNRTRDGQDYWIDADIQPLHDEQGALSGFIAVEAVITEQVAARERSAALVQQLEHVSRHDALTRLPNRSVVHERVQRAIDHHRRHPEYGFAVLFMDVDRFKQVNDTLGHAAGDDLLRQVAQRLEEALRPGDSVARVDSQVQTAARTGGDEFVIVLEGVRAPADAAQVADRLLDELSRPYRVGSHPVHASVSIGIVGAEQAGEDADAVLRDCDTAMYEAKRAGRGRWVWFDASMHERVRAALELEGELRRALSCGELYVVYQPVVDLADRALAGVEALVRWRHPQRGEIPPGQFIALAEECGLIDAIGDFVLHAACAQFARWQERWGDDAPRLLAVNLSRAQLKQPGLVPEVVAVLQASGMKPEQLQLEVTESFAAQDLHIQAQLHALKAAGVRLSLDDFGTGYSSLACLHQLPVDTVKIDRSFVAHAREVEYHRVLISATIRVARTLGMTTVAEGIETDDQAELMGELACDRGQGWLFGRPMTAEALDRWLEEETSGTLA